MLSINPLYEPAVVIGEINANDLLAANLNPDKTNEPLTGSLVGLNDYRGKYRQLADSLASLSLPASWTVTVKDGTVQYQNEQLAIKTNVHPLKEYFQAIISREAKLGGDGNLDT
jgi:hypothetical protein